MSAAAAAQNTASSDYVQEFEDFMAQLSLDPEKDQVVSELGGASLQQLAPGRSCLPTSTGL